MGRRFLFSVAIELERKSQTKLRRERNSDRGSWSKEISEPACRNQKLLGIRDRSGLRTRSVQTNRGRVEEIVDSQHGNIGDIVCARIIPIEEVEEFHEWSQRPTLVDRETDG